MFEFKFNAKMWTLYFTYTNQIEPEQWTTSYPEQAVTHEQLNATETWPNPERYGAIAQ